MGIKSTVLFFVINFYLFLTSCDVGNCDVIADQIRFSDDEKYKGETYFLYTRTVGAHNKTIYFELYDQQPEFDECRKSNIKPVYSIPYEDYSELQYVQQLILQPNDSEKIKVIYTKDKTKGVENIYDVKFSR